MYGGDEAERLGLEVVRSVQMVGMREWILERSERNVAGEVWILNDVGVEVDEGKMARRWGRWWRS